MIPWLALGLACTINAGETWPLTGTVLEVHSAELVVDHDDIDGFMKGMAMAFDAEPSLTRKVVAGDVIRAQLLVSGGQYRLTGIEVTGHEDLATRADNPPPMPLALGELLPSLTVATSGGDVVVGQGQGVPTILTFLFTSCPNPAYCPALASRLGALAPKLGDQARIVAITLDPETDSLAVLDGWGAQFGAGPPRWLLGRLPLEQLTPLLGRAGVNRILGDGPLTHNLVLLALDASGRVVFKAPDNRWDEAALLASLGVP